MANTSLQKRKTNELALPMKRARMEVVHDLANKVMNGNKAIVNSSYLVYPWLTRHMVNGCIRRIKKREETSVVMVPSSSNNAIVVYTNKKSGRPKGSTEVSKLSLENNIQLAKDRMVILYETSRNENGGSLKRGSFKKIHDTVLTSLGIHDKGLSISVRCIKTRVLRNSLTVDAQCNQKSPMAQIEPILLQISLWKQDAGQPITPTEGLCLAN